jgi:AcrR family transcriptional regulator
MEDKRKRYTKMFLRESLIKKLKEKPISRITITELCKDAEINRATYYAHYTDQYDQLKQIENEFMENIVRELSSLHESREAESLLNVTEEIIGYISDNAELCRVLLGNNGSIDFQESITEFLLGTVTLLWNNKIPVDAATKENLYYFVAAGSIGVVRKWLFNPNDKRTPHEIAAFIVKLADGGIKAFMS